VTTKEWGIEEEKMEYQLDGMVVNGTISEREAQLQLPGYNAPGHYGCSCVERVGSYRERHYDEMSDAERQAQK
jgi:hypothetical protein